MSVSVIDVQCSECRKKYTGYINDLPMAEVIYSSDCPHCSSTNDISNKAGWIDQAIPVNGVELKMKSNV